MSIEKEPFRKYSLEENKIDIVTLRFNVEERKQLEEDKQIIEQAKDGTAIKQLAMIGSYVLHDKKMAGILGIIFANKRKNQRTGIADFE